jgi:2-phosphosulfolactate phosphatase
VLLARDVEDALAARERWSDALLLKDGTVDPRFDLANSPGQLRAADLSGRTVVQVTGNGTRGAHAVANADVVLCTAFVTAEATLRALQALVDQDVDALTMVVTEGDEDRALADYLTDRLLGSAADPAQYLARADSSPAAAELRRRGGDERFAGNHRDDAALCLKLDAFDFALRARTEGDYLSLQPTAAGRPKSVVRAAQVGRKVMWRQT